MDAIDDEVMVESKVVKGVLCRQSQGKKEG